MKRLLFIAFLILGAVPAVSGAEAGQTLAQGLKNPSAVAVGLGGKVFVTVRGDKDGEGAVLLIQAGKAMPFAAGLDDPRAIAAFQQWLFVLDKKGVRRIDPRGTVNTYVAASALPGQPTSLQRMTVDPETGIVYVLDSGDTAKGAALYRITPQRGGRPMIDSPKLPPLKTPSAMLLDGASHLLLADSGRGELHRMKLADGSDEKVADGLGACDGLAWDFFGHLFLSDSKSGQLLVIPRPGEKPVRLPKKIENPVSLCLGPTGKGLLSIDPRAGTLSTETIAIPGYEVDERPLPLQTAVAFPDLEWASWNPETSAGKPNPLRPIVLTHAGDGSNRVFVATQQGVLHVFPNDQKATKTKVALDIQDRVAYDDKTNEEGLLGVAFHPKYKQNGEVFVFYTPKKTKMTNIVARFKVSKNDPDKIDPASEEEIIRFTKPYWNHDGGTICFGPDGYLYITHGDGGLGNDPHENGQNLNTLLGKILRVDVDHKADGKNYAIPKDNPFAQKEGARPEIWAYGLRNIWRMAFDRKTEQLWAGDVGQNLYEEIDIIVRGGNYGWNRREALHPFGVKGSGASKEFIDPIWEYHHDVGKCIIGGTVYRGTRLPELDGYYVYADYTSSKLWALRYDEKKGRVVENRTIKDRSKAMISFGEDEKGEVYLMTVTPDGRGIYWYVK